MILFTYFQIVRLKYCLSMSVITAISVGSVSIFSITSTKKKRDNMALSIFKDPFGDHTFFGFTSSLFATIIMIVMFIHFLYHDWIIQCKKLNIAKYQIWKLFKLQPHALMAALSLLSYIMFAIHQLLLGIYGTFYVNLSGNFFAPYCVAMFQQNWGLFFGKTFMYLFWFVRFVTPYHHPFMFK